MNQPQLTTKIISSNLDAILNGLNKAADVITSTMGGAGKNVILNNQRGLIFTKDGVSVAREIKLSDPIENIGASFLIDAANKTVEQCGDGTTLTCLFTKVIIEQLLEEAKTKDINQVLENLDGFIEDVSEELRNKSHKVETLDDIYRIAKTSCKSPSIGNLIKEIYSKTGFDASISVEASRISDTTYYQIIEGLTYNSGIVNSRFANQDNGSCVLENVAVVLEDEIVSSPESYITMLDEALQADQSIVIIAPQFSDVFIKFALTNKIQRGLKICLIKSPSYGSAIKENYKDILAFSSDGFVDKLMANHYSFTLFNNTNKDKINNRVNQLEKLAKAAVESYDEKDYLDRINKLNQTGAIIYVGGITDKNIKEEYDRIEDAVGAVKSAIQEGYVRGAGCELAAMALSEFPTEDMEWKYKILTSPINKILSNANITRGISNSYKPFNVISKQVDETIIDPTSVLINSLKNAASLAKLLINTSYVVHNE